jgi:hypothetical protein
VPATQWIACSAGHGAKGRRLYDWTRSSWLRRLRSGWPGGCLPPQLRVALYQVLTRLDGIRLVGGVTDLAGRRAVGVAIDVDRPLHERNELLLEPAAGRLLGTQRLTRKVPGWRVPAGTVIDERVFLEASVVDSCTRPPGS